jgi:hypothetical protein
MVRAAFCASARITYNGSLEAPDRWRRAVALDRAAAGDDSSD